MNIAKKSDIGILRKNKNFMAIVDWRVKNDFLKEQINNLGKLHESPIVSIALFLLKTQLAEFELKQLISRLDLHLAFSSPTSDIRLKPRTPRELDEDKITLGGLNKIMQRYQGKFLEKLQNSLKELLILRNNFVHQLFNPSSLSNMIKDAKKGLKLVDQAIIELEIVEKYLKKIIL